jgi:hypothetical protein
MTAFAGRSVDPNDDPAIERTDNYGYAYSQEQAAFFASIQLYYYESNQMTPGETQDQVGSDLVNYQNCLSSDNYNTRQIKEIAYGMIDGLMNWDTGSDALDTDVGTLQKLGKSIYLSQIAGGSPLSDVTNDLGMLARYQDLLTVWTNYQRIFGNNAPLTRCQTGSYKQWDINFEGVAHYGLIPDFLQDLSNDGLQAEDMSVLFHSAEAFAQMWTKCLQGSYAFVPHFFGPIVLQPDGTLLITYATGIQDYNVEETTDLANWQPASLVGIFTNGVVRTIQVPGSAQAKFYRLRHP